jgi:hypothetical protein
VKSIRPQKFSFLVTVGVGIRLKKSPHVLLRAIRASHRSKFEPWLSIWVKFLNRTKTFKSINRTKMGSSRFQCFKQGCLPETLLCKYELAMQRLWKMHVAQTDINRSLSCYMYKYKLKHLLSHKDHESWLLPTLTLKSHPKWCFHGGATVGKCQVLISAVEVNVGAHTLARVIRRVTVLRQSVWIRFEMLPGSIIFSRLFFTSI